MALEVLDYAFMQRALVAAVLVGIAAPTVGIFLVQRRLSLIGDGLGHVALAGVAVGILTEHAPVWTALIAATAGAVAIELIRREAARAATWRSRSFYGGIAAGVVIISQADSGTPANLNTYLFGAITTTTSSDLVTFVVLTLAVLAVTVGLGRYLFAVSNDEEFARATGLPVTAINLTLAIVTAVTVVVSIRVVGLLLISALMIVPVATAQLVARSFATTMMGGVVVGLLVSVAGVTTSFYADTPSGGTIVLIAVGLFAVTAVVTGATRRRQTHRALTH